MMSSLLSTSPKVEELIVNKDLNIAINSENSGTLLGTAKIRDEMCSIIHFDRWLGKGKIVSVNMNLSLFVTSDISGLGLSLKTLSVSKTSRRKN